MFRTILERKLTARFIIVDENNLESFTNYIIINLPINFRSRIVLETSKNTKFYIILTCFYPSRQVPNNSIKVVLGLVYLNIEKSSRGIYKFTNYEIFKISPGKIFNESKLPDIINVSTLCFYYVVIIKVLK